MMVCKKCHCKCVQLSKVFGSWPPECFKVLNDTEKHEFFNNIKELSDSKSLVAYTERYLKMETESAQGVNDNVKYLPLCVWKSRGFSAKKVKLSTDTQEHPVLGKLYGLALSSKFSNQAERQIQGVVHQVTDAPRQPAVSAGGGIGASAGMCYMFQCME